MTGEKILYGIQHCMRDTGTPLLALGPIVYLGYIHHHNRLFSFRNEYDKKNIQKKLAIDVLGEI